METHNQPQNEAPPPPQRMTKEEEKALFSEIRKGNSAVMQRLVTRNMRLVVHYAKRWNTPDSGRWWDLVMAGVEGLMLAAWKYDPEQGARFGTYAAFWIRQKMRKEHAGWAEFSSVNAQGLRVNAKRAEMPKESAKPVITRRWKAADVMELMLDTRIPHRDIIQLHYGLNGRCPMSQQGIADLYGITRQTVAKRLATALKAARRIINKGKE